jgi:hypothetical protein
MILLVVLIWVVCSILMWGYYYAYFVRGFRILKNEKEQLWAAILGALGGPMALIAFYFSAGKKGFQYGLLWFPPHKIYSFCNFKKSCKKCSHKIFCLTNMSGAEEWKWDADMKWVDQCVNRCLKNV